MLTVDLSTALQIAMAITAVFASAMSVLIYIVTRNRSKSEYDNERSMAMLSEMRSSYEHQLARLSTQLMATEDRWRETNHLLISSQNHQPQTVENPAPRRSNFVADLGIDQDSIIVDPKLVFFLTPFSTEEHRLYIRVQRICAVNGLNCIRGDETHAEGEILPHIVRLILQSRFVIANITSRNPNVFYELGLANALGKPSVLIARTEENLPFDVQSKRTIIFNDYKDLELKLSRTFVRMFSDAENTFNAKSEISL